MSVRFRFRDALRWFACSLPLIVMLEAGSIAGAAEIELGPNDDWFSVLSGSSLEPGDEVVLREGVYSDSRKLILRHQGTKEAPIVIRGKTGERVVIQRPDARQNTLNLEGAQHLVLRDFEITGGSSGIRISDPENGLVRGITLKGLHIHHIGGVAVTCNHPDHTYEEMHFLDNYIHHTGGHGEGFYLGANNDKEGKTVAVFCDSIVERNYIHHLNGETVSQGDGIEVKDGSYGNTIRKNVIHDTKYPGITVYGTDGRERNLIEGNVIWNTGDHGIQVAAEARVVRNTVFDTGGDGIRSQNHQSARVGNLEISNNTVIKDAGIGIRIETGEGLAGPVVIRGNSVMAPQLFRYAEDEKLILEGNIPLQDQSGEMRKRIRENSLREAKR